MQIFKLFFKNKKGEKVEYDIGADAINIQENSTHRFITDVERQQWNAKLEEKDLGAAAKYAVANNDTTTAPGFLADARVVKQHGDEIDQINSDLNGIKTYSSTEQVIGLWMDGKSLYRKVDSFTMPTLTLNAWNNFHTAPSGVNLKRVYGIVDNMYPLPYVEPSFTMGFLFSDNLVKIISNSNNLAGKAVSFVMEYTK